MTHEFMKRNAKRAKRMKIVGVIMTMKTRNTKLFYASIY